MAESPKHDLGELRQRQVIFWTRQGLGDKGVAAVLRISPFTVRYHLRFLLQKFGVESKAGLVWVTRELVLDPASEPALDPYKEL